MGRVFANGPGDRGSIPGRVILKLKKWFLVPSFLIFGTMKYVSRVKWNNPGKGVAPSPLPRCISFWKGDSGSPATTVTNFTFTFICAVFKSDTEWTWCFFRCHRGNEPYRTVKCRVRQILPDCFSPDLPLRFGAWPLSLCFLAELVLSAVWLLYCHPLRFHISRNWCFWFLPQRYRLVRTR